MACRTRPAAGVYKPAQGALFKRQGIERWVKRYRKVSGKCNGVECK